MSGPTMLLPFQPSSMSTAQLAAVSFLAPYSGRTHRLDAFQLREWFSWREAHGLDPLVGVQRAHVELYIRGLGECGLMDSSVVTMMHGVHFLTAYAAGVWGIPRSLTSHSVLQRVTTAYAVEVGEQILWDPDAIAYIRSRGDRYPDGVGIEPEWTQEVMADVDLLALEPDPKSRMGASRFMGRSRTARRVLVVIAYRDLHADLHGINAWPATGADLRLYQEGDDDGQDG